MITTYATFDPAQLGTGIDLEQSGTVISVGTNNSLSQYTRCTLGKDELSWEAELAVWGESDITGKTSIGIVNGSAATNQSVGGDANGWGYRLAEGKVFNNGASLATVDTAAKKQIIGIKLERTGASPNPIDVTWLVDGAPIYTTSIADDTYYLAVSLAVPSGTDSLRCFLNAGQRAFFYATGNGWYLIPAQKPTIRIAAEDHIDAPDDVYPNAVYESRIAERSRVKLARAVSFWPDGEGSTRNAAMKVKAINADGAFDDWLNYDSGEVPVNVYEVQGGNKVRIAALTLDQISASSDVSVSLSMKDDIAELERPLQTKLTMPFVVEANANRPWPIILGAARSTSPVLLDEAQFIYALSDEPVVGLGYVRDKGDPWNPNAAPPDYTVTTDRLKMDVASHAAPQGKVTADLSSVGGGTEPTSADDIFDSKGNPFVWSGSPATLDGWTVADGSIVQNQFNASAVDFDLSSEATAIKEGTNLIAGRAYRYKLKFIFNLPPQNTPFTQSMSFGLATKSGAYYYPVTPMWNNFSKQSSQPYAVGTGIAEVEGTFVASQNAPILLYGTGGSIIGYEVTVLEAILYLIPNVYTPAAIEPIRFRPFAETILTQRAGIPGGKVDLASADAIDTTTGYTGIGFANNGEPMTLRDAMELALPGYTACMHKDATGRITFTRLVAPESQTATHTVEQGDMLTELVKTLDEAPGLTTRMGYRRNWTVLDDTDFVTDFIDVPRDVRRALSSKHQGVAASAVQLPSVYRKAKQADVQGTLLDNEADTQTEIDRVCGIYAKPRAYYTTKVFAPEYDVGDIVLLHYNRYGLADGINVMVKQMIPDLVTGETKVVFWGESK